MLSREVSNCLLGHGHLAQLRTGPIVCLRTNFVRHIDGRISVATHPLTKSKVCGGHAARPLLPCDLHRGWRSWRPRSELSRLAPCLGILSPDADTLDTIGRVDAGAAVAGPDSISADADGDHPLARLD